MPVLKLGKLPDRTPVKHTITVAPTLEKRLRAYTAMYNETHQNGGEPEEMEELIPYILEAFLDSDKAFLRQLKQLTPEVAIAPTPGGRQPARRQNGALS